MKFKSLLLLFSLIISLCSAQSIHITFRVSSPELADDSSVFITGSVEQLGYWNPGKVKMDWRGNHTWIKEIEVPAPVSIEYKYTLGSWASEGADNNNAPLQNLNVNVKGDTAVNDVISHWTNGFVKREIHGGVTGMVKYHRDLKGDDLAPRNVVVWLPSGYYEDAKKRYPVLYMQDGQNIFDPATSSFGVDWRIDESCDSLIRVHAIEPVIIVGIYNTFDRTAEYSPGKKGTEYMDFVVHKVKPFIDSVYRTKPDSKHTMVGGSSSGGIISFMLAWEHPDVFSKAICMSPAFKIESIDYVSTVESYEGKKKNAFFYIDNGGIGVETELQPGVNEMMRALDKKGYKKGEDYVYVSAPDARHSEAAWAKRFPYAIEWCLSRK